MPTPFGRFLSLVFALGLVLFVPNLPAAEVPFAIEVIDDQTGRGVPLVELRTVDGTSFWTDSNGLIAFNEPGLLGQKVFFHVESPGYEVAKDGFGSRGQALDVRPGGAAKIKIKRTQIGERLYRVTGVGIYRDSVLLDRPAPIREPTLNGLVAGQDSVQVVAWQDKLLWLWGDTNRPAYPLGLFHTSGATSLPPNAGGLDPSRGVDLTYYVGKDGFSRAMAAIEGPGVVWLEGLAPVDDGGRRRLVARYSRLKGLGEMLEHGLAIFDDQGAVFRKHCQFDMADQWHCPRGQATEQTAEGTKYLLFASPYPIVRVPATLAAVSDPRQYEAFTCLPPGGRFAGKDTRLDRDGGKLVYGWKRGAQPLEPGQENELLKAGLLKPEEVRFLPKDVAGDRRVILHSGSVHWNAYRKRWLAIAVEVGGKESFLGEVWLSEAESPTGPWTRAVKIATHPHYSFYNPTQHPFFDQQGGRLIYFEGTYTASFSGNRQTTPRYEYNQLMYRLDLADPRLAQ